MFYSPTDAAPSAVSLEIRSLPSIRLPRSIHCSVYKILLLLFSYTKEITANLLIHAVQLYTTGETKNSFGKGLIRIAIKDGPPVGSMKDGQHNGSRLPCHFKSRPVDENFDLWQEEKDRTDLINHLESQPSCNSSCLLHCHLSRR